MVFGTNFDITFRFYNKILRKDVNNWKQQTLFKNEYKIGKI